MSEGLGGELTMTQDNKDISSDPVFLLNHALEELGAHPRGDVNTPAEGLIASNFFVDTAEYDTIVIRANNLEGNQAVSFETKALAFLGERQAPVPKILTFADGSTEKHINGKRVIAYLPILGETLNAEELNNLTVARDAGELLRQIVQLSSEYTPIGDEPDGDVNFIKKLTEDFIKRYPDLGSHLFFAEALKHMSNNEFSSQLGESPKGIVHADYFYENIIQRDGKLVGVIDYGDSYYGALINDVVIGAMEFSVLEDGEVWIPELFAAFLEPHANWLKKNSISFELFKNVLLANCVRFAVYTLGFERDENPHASADDNRYVQRYFKFRDSLASDLMQTYESVVNK